MSTETKDKSNAEQLLEQATQHLETRAQYISLLAVEKGSEVLGSLAGILVLVLFGTFILFFFSMGFAFWIGERIGSQAGGFALAGLIFVPAAIFSYLWIKPMVRSKIIQVFLADDDVQSKDAHTQPEGTAEAQRSLERSN